MDNSTSYNDLLKSQASKINQYNLGKAIDANIEMEQQPILAQRAADNLNDEQQWKLLVDMNSKEKLSTNEANAYRQKRILEIIAESKRITQKIAELERILAERSRLESFEEKYKDSPMWRLAKKAYINTGDLTPIESFITRENALEESKKNRLNTLELNKAQKTEQLEYDLDEAQKNVELAENTLRKTKTLGVPLDIRNAKIAYNYAVKKLNEILNKLGREPSDYQEEYLDEPKEIAGDAAEKPIDKIITEIPEIYATVADKSKAAEEIKNHSAYKNSEQKAIDALKKIQSTKTQEEINAADEKSKKDKAARFKEAEAAWKALSKIVKADYQDGIITYDKDNADHVLFDEFKVKFGIKWEGDK